MAARSSPVFRRYTSIRQQCYNPNYKDYPKIGGRGIRCNFNNSSDFSDYVLSNLGPPPYGRYSKLSRIDYTRDFEPGNLEWITHDEMSNKQSTCIYLSYRRQKKTIGQWAKHFNVNSYTAYRRYHRGLSFSEIFKTRK